MFCMIFYIRDVIYIINMFILAILFYINNINRNNNNKKSQKFKLNKEKQPLIKKSLLIKLLLLAINEISPFCSFKELQLAHFSQFKMVA